MPADFADWLDFVAVGALLAFAWHVETYVFALFAICLGLPYLLVGPFAGVIIDRSDLRKVLIASNVGRAIASALLAFAPGWPALLGLILLRSSVDAFFTPARQAAIQVLAPPETRASVNGISHGINQASKIVGPAIGGLFLPAVGTGNVFLLNAAVSLLAAALLAGIPAIDRPVSPHGSRPRFVSEIRSGIAEVRNNAILLAALGLMAAGYFAMFLYDTLIAPLTHDMGFTETDLGLVLSAVGAGGVAGSVWMARIPEFRRPFRWIAAGFAVSGASVLVIGAGDAFALPLQRGRFLALFALLGVASALMVVPVRTLIQNEVPEDRIARITALSEAANTTALLSAPFLGAWIASYAGIGAAFMLGGAVSLAVAGWAILLNNRVGRPPPRPDGP